MFKCSEKKQPENSFKILISKFLCTSVLIYIQILFYVNTFHVYTLVHYVITLWCQLPHSQCEAHPSKNTPCPTLGLCGLHHPCIQNGSIRVISHMNTADNKHYAADKDLKACHTHVLYQRVTSHVSELRHVTYEWLMSYVWLEDDFRLNYRSLLQNFVCFVRLFSKRDL